MDDGKGNGDMTSRAARDDASVLKEIGRRIREGMAARAAAAPADGAPSVDTTSTEVPNPDGALVIERNARAAHEIRTPLSAIATAAEVMPPRPTVPPTVRWLMRRSMHRPARPRSR